MAEVAVGTKFNVTVYGVGQVELEVTALKSGGLVELTDQFGGKQEVPISKLFPDSGSIGIAWSATADVVQLQADPPAAIARIAENIGPNVLPSPVAEPTIKIFDPLFGDLHIDPLEK